MWAVMHYWNAPSDILTNDGGRTAYPFLLPSLF